MELFLGQVTYTIQRNWYKINDKWYHCITLPDGSRYVDGKLQDEKADK